MASHAQPLFHWISITTDNQRYLNRCEYEVSIELSDFLFCLARRLFFYRRIRLWRADH